MREKVFRAIVGTMVLASVALTYFVDIRWLFLGVFVGLNLLQSAFTKICPLEMILKSAGIKEK